MKKIIAVIATVFVMLMMVSAVTAVPYEHQEQSMAAQREEQEEIQEVIQNIRNSPDFLQMEQIANDNFPEDKKQYVLDTVDQFFIDQGIPMEGEDDIFLILIIVAEIIILILGHNIVGETLAFVMATLVAIPYSLILAFGLMAGEVAIAGVMFLIAYAFLRDMIDQLWDEMWQEFFYSCGLIFGFIILGILGTFLLVVGIPVWYIVSVVMGFAACVEFMFEYCFGGTVISQLEQAQFLRNFSLKTPMSEFLNNPMMIGCLKPMEAEK